MDGISISTQKIQQFLKPWILMNSGHGLVIDSESHYSSGSSKMFCFAEVLFC